MFAGVTVFLMLRREDELDRPLLEDEDESWDSMSEGRSFLGLVALEDTGEKTQMLFDFLQLEQVPEPGMPMSHL